MEAIAGNRPDEEDDDEPFEDTLRRVRERLVEQGTNTEARSQNPKSESRMKVFIGWSGDRSKQLASALRDWLPFVLHYVDPWMSDVDIAAGERWGQAVAKELATSNFGILAITRENVASPWILFEAGSLSKSFDESQVIPVLLDLELKDIGGPLADFQAKKADKAGITDVVQSINKAAPTPDTEVRIAGLFDALWSKLEEEIGTIPEHAAGAKPVRTQSEVLEELVAGVRALDSRLREVEESWGASARRGRLGGRFGRRDSFMMHELAMRVSRPGDPVGLLVVASMFKDDLPWLYEMGLDAYRAARAGATDEAEACIERFREAAEMLLRGPWSEEMGIHPRELHMIIEEMIPRMLDAPTRKSASVPTRRRKPEAKA